MWTFNFKITPSGCFGGINTACGEYIIGESHCLAQFLPFNSVWFSSLWFPEVEGLRGSAKKGNFNSHSSTAGTNFFTERWATANGESQSSSDFLIVSFGLEMVDGDCCWSVKECTPRKIWLFVHMRPFWIH